MEITPIALILTLSSNTDIKKHIIVPATPNTKNSNMLFPYMPLNILTEPLKLLKTNCTTSNAIIHKNARNLYCLILFIQIESFSSKFVEITYPKKKYGNAKNTLVTPQAG